MNTVVLPTTWPGVKGPPPMTTNSTCWSSQVAVNAKAFLALIGSAAAPYKGRQHQDP